ncbi:hypothetical protein ACFFRR_011323 [Megaselia abdita]
MFCVRLSGVNGGAEDRWMCYFFFTESAIPWENILCEISTEFCLDLSLRHKTGFRFDFALCFYESEIILKAGFCPLINMDILLDGRSIGQIVRSFTSSNSSNARQHNTTSIRQTQNE